MKALSILQPWAWLIVRPDLTDPDERRRAFRNRGIKDVENRRWATQERGDVVIHAGKKWAREQREDLAFVRQHFPEIPLPDKFDLGGIVGMACLVECVDAYDSPWFFGPYGFVLANARPAVEFVPLRGQLGFFQVPPSTLATAFPGRKVIAGG